MSRSLSHQDPVLRVIAPQSRADALAADGVAAQPVRPASFLRAREGLEQLLRKARELRHELASVVTSYPDFVTRRNGALAQGEMPVFVFHTIEPASFERQLRHLVDNGYRTLSLDEFFAILAGRSRPRGREVLLTIDDARSSVWRFGFPLLKRHGCRATVFAIPGWTPDAPGVRANLRAPVSDAAAIGALQAEDPDDSTLCTWPELRAMQESGHVEVQSHSHRHARVFVDMTALGFLQPGTRAARFDGDGSAYLVNRRWLSRDAFASFHGAPLFRTRSFCYGHAYLEMPESDLEPFLRQYAALVAEGHAADRQERLARLLRRRLERLQLRIVDAQTAFERLVEELALARHTLIEQLGDPAVGRYFCIPYTEGSEATVAAARRVGIEGVFWGVRRDRPVNRPLDDPYGLSRIKGDFILRLPGQGRASLADVYAAKALRRARGQSPY